MPSTKKGPASLRGLFCLSSVSALCRLFVPGQERRREGWLCATFDLLGPWTTVVAAWARRCSGHITFRSFEQGLHRDSGH